MKKFTSLLLALLMILSLAACGAKEPAKTDAPPAEGGAWTPEENVTIIVAYKAGSGTDNTARVLAAYAEKYVGKPVIIENLEGGSGAIGWTALAQADPNGYTLGFLNLPNFSTSITEGL
ncbi:MAG: tripartite tricarboxylate transporter substrate-binding protein, partial [Oscillibacter sp.]